MRRFLIAVAILFVTALAVANAPAIVSFRGIGFSTRIQSNRKGIFVFEGSQAPLIVDIKGTVYTHIGCGMYKEGYEPLVVR
jgi:hypothetical protein